MLAMDTPRFVHQAAHTRWIECGARDLDGRIFGLVSSGLDGRLLLAVDRFATDGLQALEHLRDVERVVALGARHRRDRVERVEDYVRALDRAVARTFDDAFHPLQEARTRTQAQHMSLAFHRVQ